MERSGFTTPFVGILITNRYTQLHLRYLSYYECTLVQRKNIENTARQSNTEHVRIY